MLIVEKEVVSFGTELVRLTEDMERRYLCERGQGESASSGHCGRVVD